MKPNWFRILVAARKLKYEFTSLDLAKKARLTRSAAAAWLAKFSNWGYAVRVGTRSDDGRWWRIWSLTTYGIEREAPTESRAVSGTPGRSR